jgi:hypothetical protein
MDPRGRGRVRVGDFNEIIVPHHRRADGPPFRPWFQRLGAFQLPGCSRLKRNLERFRVGMNGSTRNAIGRKINRAKRHRVDAWKRVGDASNDLELGQILGIHETHRFPLLIHHDQIVNVPLVEDFERFNGQCVHAD